MADFKGQVDVLAELPESLLDSLQERLLVESHLFGQRISPSPWIYDLWSEQEGAIITHIVLGFPHSLADHRQPLRHPLFDDWAQLIEPLIALATEEYGYAEGRTTRLMFARLEPGRALRPHMDDDPASQIPHKIHIPLVTQDAAGLYIDESRYHLARGYAYEVNNRTLHWADNLGDTPRIHLIFDYWDASLPQGTASGSSRGPLRADTRFVQTPAFARVTKIEDDMTWGFEESTFDLLRAPASRAALRRFVVTCKSEFQLDELCTALRAGAGQSVPDWAIKRDALRTIAGLRELGAIAISPHSSDEMVTA